MKTVIRNSYSPKIGDYCETIVVDKETNNAYIFDCDGVYTTMPQPVDVEEILRQAAEYTDEAVAPINEKLETIEEGAQVNKIEHVLRNGTELTITNKTVNVTVPTKTSDLTNDGSDGTDTYVESDTLANYYTASETDTAISVETDNRVLADQDLQQQIDALVVSSDVVDIVGTYTDLQNYDTSKLKDNDIVKVLDDSTHNNATSYYRWDTESSTWSYIGSEGPYYTKSEADTNFVPQSRTINSKALSSNITLTASDVGALPDSTVIPTVNDGMLTIQKNGVDVQTFTANQGGNSTANITVPTDTSDLTNGAGFITSAALPTKTSDLTNDGADGTDTYAEMGDLPTKTSDLTNDGADGTSTYVEADELATVATTGDYGDLINKPTIPTVNDATLTIQKNGVDVATFTANSSTNQTANITVPTDTSDLTNGAGFITTAALANYYTKSETYSQQEVNSLINTLSIPTKTSDLTNDGSDGTSTYVEASDLTGYQEKLVAGSNIQIAADGKTISATDTTYSDFTGATSQDAGTHGLVPAPATTDVDKYLKSDGTWATVQSGGGATVTLFYMNQGPGDVTLGTNFTVYKDSALTTAATATEFFNAVMAGEVRIIGWNNSTAYYVQYNMDNANQYGDNDENFYYIWSPGESTLYNFSWFGGSPNPPYMEEKTKFQKELTAGTNISISNNTISASIPIDSALDVSSANPVENSVVTAALNGKAANTAFTGATSSVAGTAGLVPAPTTSDPDKYLKGDGTWSTVNAKLVEMSYGESNAWAKFIAAYNAGSIVYCRASSNANPGTGSQTRKAFMAYVNDASNPTNVEFQYVRSVNPKSSSQPVDQVFVYKLTNASGGTWSVVTRDMAPKLAAGTNTSVSYSSGTYTISATNTTYSDFTGATSGTAGAHGLVPAPAAGDESKFLQGDGTWATVSGGGGATLSMQDWNDLFVAAVPTVDFTVTLSSGSGFIGPSGDADYEIVSAAPNTQYELTITRTPLNATDPLTASAVMYSGGSTAPYIDNIVASGNTVTFDTLQAVGYWPTEYIILTIDCGNVSKTVKIAPN